ncbi:putative nadh-ubiquinone oxidoreductase b18-like subunit [Suhomyces tanzawaensis NRRL Y-17324]|uniref:Putative nadh-ubiquinone oxidoreductase b18-like subunit n=1 Tax=Suhomyces tanzawaensis NRRL Y-17324 TaxID=984487 RepID=A0A1E4SGA3_9ASCO|nr:putative nadh-ubiquinone oxidoreductase b18-like subunit [Suhomyces tanzawaensis NRRL Y-17324]ODV78544.1 putative nadh-ubiquinone oxidoreductase b18-like subunit [Suhomyces tanzawaensis NRRL Y-17324]
MTAHSEAYEYPPIPSQQELDTHDVPFFHRDKCAAHLINYYKCLDKGTSFCSATKDEFYKCQYIALKERLESHKKATQ